MNIWITLIAAMWFALLGTGVVWFFNRRNPRARLYALVTFVLLLVACFVWSYTGDPDSAASSGAVSQEQGRPSP